MVITLSEISIWGVRTTKKPQIWPYFGPRAYNEVSEGKLENLKHKVQLAITGAFLSLIPSVIPFRNRLVIPNLEI